MKTLLKITLTLIAIGVAVKVIKENKELNLKVENQNGRTVLLEEKIKSTQSIVSQLASQPMKTS